jgi:hypothetical protein
LGNFFSENFSQFETLVNKSRKMSSEPWTNVPPDALMTPQKERLSFWGEESADAQKTLDGSNPARGLPEGDGLQASDRGFVLYFQRASYLGGAPEPILLFDEEASMLVWREQPL